MAIVDFFWTVTENCYFDDMGVYVDSERIALDNGSRNGYIRHDGDVTYEVLNACVGLYLERTPYIFVGAAPLCTEAAVDEFIMREFTACGSLLADIDFDKGFIGEHEMIDMSKFTDVVVVMIHYVEENMHYFEPGCYVPYC